MQILTDAIYHRYKNLKGSVNTVGFEEQQIWTAIRSASRIDGGINMKDNSSSQKWSCKTKI